MPEKNKHYTQVEKAKRGWWASVVFMLLIVVLIVFLSYVKIVEENRDILIGIIGMLTKYFFHACNCVRRDPSELEEVKDKLSARNADRAALIGRLRDAQIQMQLLREQIFELQNAVIDKLSMFQGNPPITTKSETEVQPRVVKDWLPKFDFDDTSVPPMGMQEEDSEDT